VLNEERKKRGRRKKKEKKRGGREGGELSCDEIDSKIEINALFKWHGMAA